MEWAGHKRHKVSTIVLDYDSDQRRVAVSLTTYSKVMELVVLAWVSCWQYDELDPIFTNALCLGRYVLYVEEEFPPALAVAMSDAEA